MAQIVPVVDYIHVLREVGADVDFGDVVRRPAAYWERLGAEEREALLEKLSLDVPADAVVGLTTIKRRGRDPSHENVYVRLDVPDGREGRLRERLRSTRDRLLFQQLELPSPGDGDASGHVAERLPGDLDASKLVPRGLLRRGGTDAHRRVLDVLDEAWDGDPFDEEAEGPFTPPATFGGCRIVERYAVESPFSFVSIVENEENELVYHVEEPPVSELERTLLETVNERLRDVLILADAEPEDRALYLVEQAYDLLPFYRRGLTRKSAYKLGYYFVRNLLGLGRIEPVMRDPAIEDISCNGPEIPVYVVHSRHGNLPTSLAFDELSLTSFTIKLAQRGGKLLSVAQPLTDATLPDGSRVQASLGREVTSRGSAFTIRKFRESPLTAVDLIKGGTHTLDSMAFLWLAVELRCPLVVMGATASGKTTTLNALSQFIPPMEKIVSIEDTRELRLWHENWLAAVTRDGFTTSEEDSISMFDLLRAALRQRPDYVIVGEIRGEEGLTLFQAMATGHTCFSTVHAGSVENAVYRLENPPVNVPRVMLNALDFLLLQGQVEGPDGSARRMISLTELNGLESGSRNLRTNEVFRWDADEDALRNVAQSHALDRARVQRGWSRSRLDQEFDERRRVLEGLVENDEREFDAVARAVTRFYTRRGMVAPKTDEESPE